MPYPLGHVGLSIKFIKFLTQKKEKVSKTKNLFRKKTQKQAVSMYFHFQQNHSLWANQNFFVLHHFISAVPNLGYVNNLKGYTTSRITLRFSMQQLTNAH